MCQVLPFTLPCCRRVYVEVTKLPSCPDAWPEKKCPPELCIQVRYYEAEDRDAGTCWRCQAEMTGILGDEREHLRPAIDSAMIVHGLDELGVSGRRRMVEEGGNCWYCGAKAGCGVAIKAEAGIGEEKTESSRKKRRRDAGGRKENPTNKRIKVEPQDNNHPQTRAFSYPDPEQPSQWQNVFPQSYNNMPLFPGRYGLTQGSNMTGFGQPWSQSFPPQAAVPGIVSVDWASVHDEQHNGQIGFENRPVQSCTSQGPASGPQEESLNKVPYQSQYVPETGPATEVKPRVQPEINFENPTQIDDAALARLLDTYNKQKSNLGHDIGHLSPPPEVTVPRNPPNREGSLSKQETKAEQPLPTT